MEKEVIQQFLNKQVRLRTTADFFYRGRVVEILDNSFCLKDVKFGLMWFSFTGITEIQEWVIP